MVTPQCFVDFVFRWEGSCIWGCLSIILEASGRHFGTLKHSGVTSGPQEAPNASGETLRQCKALKSTSILVAQIGKNHLRDLPKKDSFFLLSFCSTFYKCWLHLGSHLASIGVLLAAQRVPRTSTWSVSFHSGSHLDAKSRPRGAWTPSWKEDF